MADPLAADPAAGDEPAPQAPSLTADQIKELVKSEATRQTDERVKGLQSTLGKQITALRNENEALRRRLPADADEDRVSDLDTERRRLQRERDLWKAAASNPQLADVLAQLDEADGPEGWASVLSAWQSQQGSATESPPTPDPAQPDDTPDVSPNRNRREPSGWGDDGPTTKQAEDYLKGYDRWPWL